MTEIATLTMNPALDVTTATETVRPGHKLRCGAPQFDPGGGGINVARVVTALGGAATAIFPSGGPPGQRIEQLLGQAQVPFRAVAIADITRESFTVDESGTGNQFRFVLPGPELSEAEQACCLEALKALPHRPRWLVASGSLPPGVPDDFYLRVGGICRSLDIRMLLDSSGPALAACAGLNAALIKPSLRELEDLVGHPIGSDEAEVAAARELIGRGFAETVLLSLGSRGALLVTQDSAERFQAIAVPVRSTVGAGDSMMGGVVLGLSRGMALRDTVPLGIAAGAAALMAPGTGLAHAEDVARLHAQLTGGSPSGTMSASPSG
ncbi:1-phosphofructokinase family hexose kinase [Sphingomonas sp. LB-2]|uniref:1-phosphofructokinase family hexose kinase n=1 Tax=Sphingomonas caeni TaxID=2984949 RepID=UPI00222EB1BA|nr:1-phosphofructokinase family hexose kinase [Sphingomonas caeni]MCW3846025.1 1-phosphofructokinase family hexose kinase [Sphingomonas caeni]